jgi:hypothetical protein
MRYYEDKLGIYYEIRESYSEDRSQSGLNKNPADGDCEKFIMICDADKKLNELTIPEYINDLPVRAIGKKSFLGCKGLRQIRLPRGIDNIGEWAFAFCDNLTAVERPRNDIKWGKGVFKNDDKLRRITIYPDCSSDPMTCRLLAAAPVIMDAEYLLDIKHAGNEEWIKKWDTRLEHILNLADDEGYHLYVLCGEEDLHFDYEEYLEYNREKKSELCMLRLINDKWLDEDFKQKLSDYINDHTAGCESDATIRILLKAHGDEQEYYKLLLDTGAVSNINLEQVLFKMGDRHAQMKAFLIEQCSSSTDGFYEDLML